MADRHAGTPPGAGDGVGRLRERLAALERDAQDNQRLLHRFFTVELALLHTTTLPALLRALVTEVASVFDVDGLSLALDDAEDRLPGLLELRGMTVDGWPQFLTGQRLRHWSPLYDDLEGPWLGAFDAALHEALFPAGSLADDLSPADIGSVACVPVVGRGERIGVLNLAARAPGRYRPGLATDFLTRFGEVLAVAVDNVVSREQLLLAGFTDVLTGLPNRRYFLDRLQQELSRAVRHGYTTACVYVDADRFKAINDQFGHGVGDEVLRMLGRRLREAVRTADVPARLGGEEFGLLLPQTGARAAHELAERIRIALASLPVETATGQEIGVTASFGVAATRAQADCTDVAALGRALLERADGALLEAKARGRNRVVVAPTDEDS